MKLIVGLGNPGAKYEVTRHNIGFIIVDNFCEKHDLLKFKSKFDGHISINDFNNEKIILLKPQTFMNLSGNSVRKVTDYYNVEIKDIIVIHDDIDFEFGRIKIKQGGGTAGHNGLKSIAEHLGSNEFGRIRVGVGKQSNVSKHVLSNFSKKEEQELNLIIEEAVDAILSILENGYTKSMNEFNKKFEEIN